jgi:hypothetical protein
MLEPNVVLGGSNPKDGDVIPRCCFSCAPGRLTCDHFLRRPSGNPRFRHCRNRCRYLHNPSSQNRQRYWHVRHRDWVERVPSGCLLPSPWLQLVGKGIRQIAATLRHPGARNGSLKAAVRNGASLLLRRLNVFSPSLASRGTRRELGAPLRVNGETLSLWICPGFYFNSIGEPRRAFTLGLRKARELGLRHAHWFAPALRDQSRRSGPASTRPIVRGPLGDTVEPRREFIEKNDLQVSNLNV